MMANIAFQGIESLQKIMNSNSPKEQKLYVTGPDPVKWESVCKKYVYEANLLNSLKINLCLMNYFPMEIEKLLRPHHQTRYGVLD